ncbi:MAG: MBL fold metallo-hydrolase [Mucilaginibacter sp.]|uniref:MBL fold metallo-hydrolase n=1 Tax=Mucilaginibacter sp. TaxID=1882438 RepID=UPI0034E4BCFA
MNIYALGEGSFSVDSTKKFVPFNPLTNNPQDRKGSIFIHVQPFLLKTEHDLILMDAGLGFKNPNGELMLHDNIRNAGFEPEEVTLVLMSHLHYDHTGGLVMERNGRMEPSFPDAEHVIQRGEWEFAFSGKSTSYRQPIFEVLQRSANITLVEGSGAFRNGVSYELTGGHTPFHQVFKIESAGKIYFFGGDVLPEPEQLIRRFAAKYDFDGRKSMELRERFGKQAAEENWICCFYHAKNLAIGKVTLNDGFSVKTLDS